MVGSEIKFMLCICRVRVIGSFVYMSLKVKNFFNRLGESVTCSLIVQYLLNRGRDMLHYMNWSHLLI